LDDTIITIYCFCDEFLKAIDRRNDPQVRLSTAEVMRLSPWSPLPSSAGTWSGPAGFCASTDTRARCHQQKSLQPACARHRARTLAGTLLGAGRGLQAAQHRQGTYAVDSLPVAACDNIRIHRCRLYPPEEHGGVFRGYIASKRRYFYGLRVHLVVTEAGEPVEFALAAGSEADVTVFKDLELDLPEGSIICADKAYTDYDYEDLLEEVGLHLKAQRKKNSKRPMPAWVSRSAPVHRNGHWRFDRVALQEDPRGHAERLRTEGRLVSAGCFHPVLVGSNLGYLLPLPSSRV
jgi:Transposase DDE domain